jgi:DNA (cytosine-5)-methyltransferase 1
MTKLRALDLFCCAGGASAGLAAAGFEVHGVDCEPQPDYPFHFVQADARAVDLSSYDFIWASPPCQGFTAYKRRKNHVRPRENLIPEVRAMLRKARKPYVIENVVGAPLLSPYLLCGSMFGLDVQRHRIFETSFPIRELTCNHKIWTPRFKPATNRTNLRKTVEVGVWRIPLAVQQQAMGIDWMPLAKLSQAIPPAYAEYLAREWFRVSGRHGDRT